MSNLKVEEISNFTEMIQRLFDQYSSLEVSMASYLAGLHW
jgi:hypothetical protein